MSLIVFLLICTVWENTRAEPLSLNEYRIRIQESIERLESVEGKIQPDETSWLQEKFPSGLKVRDIKGDRPSTGLSWEQSRALLDEVYSDRQFMHLRKKHPPPWTAFVESFLKALGKWLGKHLGALDHISGKWVQYPVYGVILILSGILIVWILRSFGSLSWRPRQPGIKPSPSFSPHMQDWTAWRDEARKKALEGAFREAIRSLFVSVLMEGHQRGWWVYEPESTNKEHLARVEGPAERRSALRKLVALYEKAWYGLGKPGKEEYRNCEEWVRQMEAAP